MATFLATFVEIGLLFSLTSGRSGCDHDKRKYAVSSNGEKSFELKKCDMEEWVHSLQSNRT